MVPDVDRDLLHCLIKIYDCLESDLKLNEVFEFFGVFTLDSEFKEDKDASYDFTNGFSEDVLVHLPSNKVPRLHCYIHRKLAVHDFLPCSPTITGNLDFYACLRVYMQNLGSLNFPTSASFP
ncbi:mini-chromosome maintenance complex-binding protein-like [Malus domestica]|uniref:mini-chromosome maintenance complex-binding protein-like n=1 Tax=Malus domestica TaxID=3750 RepID=UPI0010AAE102|nr:mini-chromosome maintenance complex-binding protein-like [Malus domestica]